MSMKLFILGLPGSGKSTIARHVIDYVGRQKSDCHTVRVNDYGILYAMYKADTEGKFSPTGRDGFDVLDPSVCDSALKTVQQEAHRAGQTINNHVQAVFKPMLILIEFARDDYNHALQQFTPHFYWALIFFFLTLTSRHAKLAFKSASLIHKHWMITKFQSISSIHIMLKRAPMFYPLMLWQSTVSRSGVLQCLTTTGHLMIFVMKLRALLMLLSNTYRQDTLLPSSIALTRKTSF